MSGMDRSQFGVGPGGLTVKDSATVICARVRPGPPVQLYPEDCGGRDSPFIKGLSGVFGAKGAFTFESGWEVLLGQGEVVNWLRSTQEKLATMRYPGEWKLAGGNVEPGDTVDATAHRELSEEFLAPLGLELPSGAKLRPFVTKQTRPIRGQSNLMHCYVALEAENGWLSELDIRAVNEGLEARRRRFASLAAGADGAPTAAFWSLPPREREAVTPEVRQVAWVPLREAVRHCLQSMTPGTFVNDFQERAFAKYRIKRRDPMFITGACLLELEGFPGTRSLVAHCEGVDLARLTLEEQWLFQGMSQDEVDEAFRKRVTSAPHGANPSFKSADMVSELRRQRGRAMRGKL